MADGSLTPKEAITPEITDKKNIVPVGSEFTVLNHIGDKDFTRFSEEDWKNVTQAALSAREKLIEENSDPKKYAELTNRLYIASERYPNNLLPEDLKSIQGLAVEIGIEPKNAFPQYEIQQAPSNPGDRLPKKLPEFNDEPKNAFPQYEIQQAPSNPGDRLPKKLPKFTEK